LYYKPRIITFRLSPEDEEIHQWWEKLPPRSRSESLRGVLRAHLGQAPSPVDAGDWQVLQEELAQLRQALEVLPSQLKSMMAGWQGMPSQAPLPQDGPQRPAQEVAALQAKLNVGRW